MIVLLWHEPQFIDIIIEVIKTIVVLVFGIRLFRIIYKGVRRER